MLNLKTDKMYSKIDSCNSELLKNIYLRDEISYVEKRLKSNQVINGVWVVDGKKIRSLTKDELTAYSAVISNSK